MKHKCHAHGCEVGIPPAKLFCRPHWYALPKEIRDRVWAAYVPGQEKTKRPTREYVAVARTAINWLRDHTAEMEANAK